MSRGRWVALAGGEKIPGEKGVTFATKRSGTRYAHLLEACRRHPSGALGTLRLLLQPSSQRLARRAAHRLLNRQRREGLRHAAGVAQHAQRAPRALLCLLRVTRQHLQAGHWGGQAQLASHLRKWGREAGRAGEVAAKGEQRRAELLSGGSGRQRQAELVG